ncbi:hypothetical protein [Saccharothrix sp. ST-888]|uniref:hypothetical protein n=1 Tax=Saccharothrix sp. ST-888 TaxID=1427391 RepID=UPI0005EC2323|nr:hypothetical protein [Saccharothrix sp. ST-888]KJK60024.1 hypothetical protein UK12_00860 [Saccharothrix sp. ST-888]
MDGRRAAPTGVATLAVAIGGLGIAVAPQLITAFGLVERTVPATRLGEAMAALVGSITLAQSAGTLTAGWAAERSGPAGPPNGPGRPHRSWSPAPPPRPPCCSPP